MLKNTHTSYGSVTKFFHWTIFFLVVAMLVLGFFMDDIHEKTLKHQVFNLHKLSGIIILSLMLLRVIWATINPKPDLPLDTPVWQRLAAYTVHFLMYISLIIIPFSGWIMSTAAGHSPHLFNIDLSFPVTQDKALAQLMGTVHYYLAWFIILLICIHVGAALYHYIFRNDGILERMLPGNDQ